MRSSNVTWNRRSVYPTVAAPRDCLQYFTSTVGVVKSFNWKDVASTSTRQLANQDYKICFRTEVIRSQVMFFATGEVLEIHF